MADYVRVFETTSEKEANDYIKNGWDLIDAPTKTSFDGDSGYSSYTKYTLGLSAKAYSNKLLAVIRDYEKYGFKEALLEKIGEETDDNVENYDKDGVVASKSPLAVYISNYEDAVNDSKTSYFNKAANAKFYPDFDPDEF